MHVASRLAPILGYCDVNNPCFIRDNCMSTEAAVVFMWIALASMVLLLLLLLSADFMAVGPRLVLRSYAFLQCGWNCIDWSQCCKSPYFIARHPKFSLVALDLLC